MLLFLLVFICSVFSSSFLFTHTSTKQVIRLFLKKIKLYPVFHPSGEFCKTISWSSSQQDQEMPSDRTLAGPCFFHFTQRMFSPVPQWSLAGWTCPQQLTISTRLSTSIQSFLEKRREAQSFPAKFQNWTQGDLIKWVLLVSFDLVWLKPLLQ